MTLKAPPPPLAVVPPPQSPAARRFGFKLEDLNDSKIWLKAMIYGQYGAGKTFLSGTASDVPEMRDVLYLDAEGGWMSIADRSASIKRVKVENFERLNNLKDFLILHCQRRDAGDIEGMRVLEEQLQGRPVETPRIFQTVIIDSLSEINKILMANILGSDPLHANLDAQVETATFEHWGQASQRIQLLVRAFRAIPVHVIFLASQKEKEDERKVVRIQPNLAGQLANDVQGFLDVVGYLAAATSPEGIQKHRLYLTPGLYQGQAFNAKHRFAGQHIPHIDEPTIGSLYDLIQKVQGGK